MTTIRELAERTGVSADTLRYYEKAGLMLPVPRHSNGHRRYGPEHVFWTHFLRRLRATGMSIGEIREYADLVKQGESTLAQRRSLLGSHRRRLVEQIATLQDSLELLDVKQSFYREREEGSCPADFTDYLRRHGREADGDRSPG